MDISESLDADNLEESQANVEPFGLFSPHFMKFS